MPLVAKKPVKTDQEAQQLHTASERLKNAFGALNDIFVDRVKEVQAIQLATVAGCHVLLQGGHGIAKSDLAREAHKRITGKDLVIYDKMFSKGTKEEDVFGPVNIERYKKEAVWVHNTDRRLPAAHFANLEELGRASDFLLPAMMTVLNERIFHNGNVVQPCPLISAIATTNFMSDDDELAAFNDRWLIRIEVKGVEQADMLHELLKVASTPRPTEFDTVSLSEILLLNKAARELPVDDDVYPMFSRLVSDFKRQTKVDLSDRRFVQSLRLARANAVLNGKSSLSCEDLDSARFGLVFLGQDMSKEQTLDSIIGSLIGNLAAERAERKDYKKVEKFAKTLIADYDDDLPEEKLKVMLSDCRKWSAALKNRDQPLKTVGLANDYAKLINQFDELAATITANLSNRF